MIADGQGGVRAPWIGERIVQPQLAKTLNRLVTKGLAEYQQGALGREVAQAVERAGGMLRTDDIREYEIKWRLVCWLQPEVIRS